MSHDTLTYADMISGSLTSSQKSQGLLLGSFLILGNSGS